MDVFTKYAPFIQEYIYNNNWQELRSVQVEAAKAIFYTENNILICSKTASGKTEAAFFPVLSILETIHLNSFGAIYLAPLKTLINDQFRRIDMILHESNTPVFHWHGDVSASHKRAAFKNPRGILQITPESLEGLMLNHHNNIYKLFNDLQFVIIDEIHFMTGTDRGNQVRCILERMSGIIGKKPRRIGLSATIGNPHESAAWLGKNTGRDTDIIFIENEKSKIKLACEHFFTEDSKSHTVEENKMYENYGDKYSYFLFSNEANNFIYECARQKHKSLIFLNTREETEYLTAVLRMTAKQRKREDIFYIHHGNISKQIRSETETDMKDSEKQTATCATVTMELGIDIGDLERVIHLGAPNSVSSFLQRLGRSGRRTNTPEMMIIINEDIVSPNALLPHLIPWELLKSIAVIQLYLEEQWIEPPVIKKMPFSLLFHQTLCVLAASYELKPEVLGNTIQSLSPFAEISNEDYNKLILHMRQNKIIQLTDEGTYIVGTLGEKIISSYKFLATFKDYDEYKVMYGNAVIGTLTSETPVGYVFTLAGFTWVVTEVLPARKQLIVEKTEGCRAFPWPGSYRDIHTKIVRKIREILQSDKEYQYLMPRAAERLSEARTTAQQSGMLTEPVLHLGGTTWCLFPWLGTKSNWTLRRFIRSKCIKKFNLTDIEYGDWFYIRLNIGKGDGHELIRYISSFFNDENPDLDNLVGKKENPTYERYDEHIPQPIIRKAYITDKLDSSEIKQWLNPVN
ncbi:MAG: DEAD/DEAH box helicase [Oscillospiraceae bacterium]|nr:DEAD/DEAH box helicase [Oscillospiraceae bacterium]